MSITLEGLAIGRCTRHGPVAIAGGLEGEARRGELTVLIGPNGAGKTTLLRTVCGLLPPIAGRVLLDDGSGESVDVAALTPAGRARRVAAVLTGARPPWAMSVRALVALGRHPHRTLLASWNGEDEGAVDTALERVGVTDLSSRRVGELSDGQRQRVLLARALAQATPVLVLDEPTAFLDAPGRRALVTLLARLAHEEERTILLCTHEVELAAAHGDRGWLLDRAGVWTTGPVAGLPREWLDG